MRLETARLILRPWCESDAEDSKVVYCDPTVRLFTGGPLAPEKMEDFVRRSLEDEERGELRLLPLIEKASGKTVGAAGLQPLAGGPEIEIGWMLARDSWGKGYATEISREVLRYGLQQLNLSRVLAIIDPRNQRSIAVAHRLGMRFWRAMLYHERKMLAYELKP